MKSGLEPSTVALREAMGVDLRAIPTRGVETVLTIAAEAGPDLSRFPPVEFEAERCERRLRREAGRLNLALLPVEQVA